MAEAKYRNKGEVIEFSNASDSATLAAGTIVSLTSRVGVVAAAIEPSGKGLVHVEGIYEFPKTTSLAISQGDAVYFSTSTNKITKTNTDVPAGYAVAGAASAATEVLVKLLG